MPRLTFWYEFASTYSYPAALRIEALTKTAGIDVTWRPFLLGPIFKAQGWQTSPFKLYPAKGAYMWRDLERICVELDLPFRRPDPFPQNSLLAARLATFGMGEGWGVAFSKAVYLAEFGEGRSIDDPSLLAELVAASGGNPEAAQSGAVAEKNKASLKEATNEAIALGLFGAPFFVTGDGEPFWGNDRLEHAVSWAMQHG